MYQIGRETHFFITQTSLNILHGYKNPFSFVNAHLHRFSKEGKTLNASFFFIDRVEFSKHFSFVCTIALNEVT